MPGISLGGAEVGGVGGSRFQCAGVSKDKKKLARKVLAVKTIKDLDSSVIVTCMAVLFASYNVQLTSSCFTSGFSMTVGSPQVRL